VVRALTHIVKGHGVKSHPLYIFLHILSHLSLVYELAVRIEKYRGVTNAMRLPTPDHDIVTWAHEAYVKSLEVSIWKSFQSFGFQCTEFEEIDIFLV
jgi:hypothetical protein